eukprot:62622_1
MSSKHRYRSRSNDDDSSLYSYSSSSSDSDYHSKHKRKKRKSKHKHKHKKRHKKHKKDKKSKHKKRSKSKHKHSKHHSKKRHHNHSDNDSDHSNTHNNQPKHKKRKLNTHDQVISLISDDENDEAIKNENNVSDFTMHMPSLIPDTSTTNNLLKLNSEQTKNESDNNTANTQIKTKHVPIPILGKNKTDTEIINQGWKFKANEAVKYYTNVIKERKHLEGEALFRIANAYEVEKDYKNAIIYYQKRLNGNFKWQSPLNVHHLALNLLKQNNLIATSQIIDLFIQSWQLSAIKKYQQKYVDDKILQLIGSAKSAVELGQIFKDKHNGDNNQSLIWYKRAMNLLEKKK